MHYAGMNRNGGKEGSERVGNTEDEGQAEVDD